jgi:hypothetical protein
MTQSAPKRIAKYTWDDYQGRDDGERWEIIDGEAYAMSPSPQSRHQRIAMDLGWKIREKITSQKSNQLKNQTRTRRFTQRLNRAFFRRRSHPFAVSVWTFSNNAKIL